MTGGRPAAVLAALAALFACRVAGQLVVWLGLPGAGVLPPMRAWYSGLVPYPVLLPVQLAILAAMAVHIAGRWRLGDPAPRPRLARFLLAFAAAYAGAMLLRYALATASNGVGPAWWANGLIPVVFHQVLAGYLAVWGASLKPADRRPWA